MSHSNPQLHHRRHFSFYILHRYLGLLAALFVLLLAITGIMLNHTETLRLDERDIKSSVILDWYGLDANITGTGYRIGEHWVSNQQQSIYIDDKLLDVTFAGLIGAVKTKELIVLATRKKIILLTPAGELVDEIDQGSGLPAGKILGLGLSPVQQAAIKAADGTFVASSDFLSWSDNLNSEIIWSSQKNLPDALKISIAHNWRGEGVTLERLVLDLHSGRLLGGSWGVLLIDLAALLMLLLVITGVWLWLNRWRKRIIHKRAYKRHHLQKTG